MRRRGAVLLLGLGACEPAPPAAPPPLPQAECPDAGDLPCLAERARKRFAAQDVEGGLREVRAIPDLALRDLVVAEAVRTGGWDLCAEIQDPALQATCRAGVAGPAPGIGAAAAPLPPAAAACGALPGGSEREVCLFRTAEEAPDLSLEDRLVLCRFAGSFQAVCSARLASGAAHEAVLTLWDASFAAALTALADREDEVRRLLAPVGVPEESLAREYWTRAWHDLLLEAGCREDLGRWRLLGEAVDVGPTARSLYPDLLAVAWARRAALDPTRSADLSRRDLAGWTDAFAADVSRSVAPVRTPTEPLLLPPVPATCLPAVPGKLPSVLDPRTGCALSAGDRVGVAVLWGAGPGPWSVGEGLYPSALAHPALGVRAAALEVLEDAAWTWHLHGETPPEWLGRALDGVVASDPSPLLRARAAEMRQRLGTKERPAGWSVPADRLCAGGEGTPSGG